MKKKKHILIITQYFFPETFRINDMALEWVKRGYQVSVVTGIPNYPMGKFYEGYGYVHHRLEHWKGIRIIRIPLIPRGSSSVGMIANYLSFVCSGWIWNQLTRLKADLVFTFEVSPMTQALVGVWYAKEHHVPHYLYVQDLWPENVETVTGIRHPLVIQPIDRMVDYIYNNTDEIFTTSPSFVEAIVNRKVPVDRKKVHFWPQYAEEFYKKIDCSMVRETAGEAVPWDALRKKAFKIAFTGNIGTAQGLDILPKTAEILKKRNCEDICFVIVGDGRYQEEFCAEIKSRQVEDYFMVIPRQRAEQIPKILAFCDVAFLSFADTPLWEKTIPAKLQSYLACGKPVLAAASGETRRILEDAGCGMCVPIGDAGSLAEMVLQMQGMDLEQMGQNAIEYCTRHFEKKMLMDEMERYLEIAFRKV